MDLFLCLVNEQYAVASPTRLWIQKRKGGASDDWESYRWIRRPRKGLIDKTTHIVLDTTLAIFCPNTDVSPIEEELRASWDFSQTQSIYMILCTWAAKSVLSVHPIAPVFLMCFVGILTWSSKYVPYVSSERPGAFRLLNTTQGYILYELTYIGSCGGREPQHLSRFRRLLLV